MITDPPVARTARRAVRWSVLAFVAVVVSGAAVLVATAAYAFWPASGGGTATGSTATLGAASNVLASGSLSTVGVSWTSATTPSGATLTGYYVTRYTGATPSSACGTVAGSVGTYLGAGATSCSDTGLVNGTYAYTVTAVFRTWDIESAQSNQVVVNVDGTGPSLALTMAPGATNASMTGSSLYFRPSAAGSVSLNLAVTDSFSGPASATFPALATAGWTHAAETVTTGSGSAPTITYTSSPFTWTAGASTPSPATITGRDVANNPSTVGVAFVPDSTAPTGGSLTVNSVAASAAGSTSLNKTGSFTIGARVDYASDTGSGVASSVLTRDSATLVAGTCGTFGGPAVLSGSPAQSGLTNGCYRFTLAGTDKVGNVTSVSTIVKVDTVAPTQTLSYVSGTATSYLANNRLYFKQTAAGSFVLASTVVDNESGPASATFPVIATTGWTHNAEVVSTPAGAPSATYPSTTWSWTAGASTPASKTVTATDAASNTLATTLAFTKDVTAPGTGALKVNGTTGAAAGVTSNSKTGSFAITRTDYVEAQTTTAAGLASSVLTLQVGTLTNGACSGYGAPTVLVGAPAQAGLATGCYLYTLTGTDNVTNAASKIVTVRVDLSAPTAGSVSVNGTSSTSVGSTTNNTTGSWNVDSFTPFVDTDSGMSTNVLTRATATLSAGGTCGAFGAATTVSGTAPVAQTGLARNCYKYVYTGTNVVGLTATSTITVKVGPYVTAVSLVNGTGTAGKVDKGDQIVITFSDTMNPSTFCSTWTSSGDQSLTADNNVTVTLTNAASDTITVSSASCTFNFGSLALGSGSYTTVTQTYVGAGINKSTVTWTAATRTMTVTLGTTAGVGAATVASSTATYTPSTSVLNSDGLALGGTFATAAVKQF